MKNHVINYKKYITLIAALTITMVGVATVPDLDNSIKYDVVDVDSGEVIYHMPDGVNLKDPSIINEWNDFDNGQVPFNTGYTSYPYQINGNTAKSIAIAEKTVDVSYDSHSEIPKGSVNKVTEKNITGENGNIKIEEYIANDKLTLPDVGTIYGEALKYDAVQIQLQMDGTFKKGETYTYKLSEETFNKLPNKELSLPKSMKIEGWNDSIGSYNTQATLTLDTSGVLTIKFDEDSWFSGNNSELSTYYFSVPFVDQKPVTNATKSLQIPFTPEKNAAMKDHPALWIYNLVKDDIPYNSVNINGTQFNTFEHEIKLVENNLNRNKIGKYKQVYEVTTLGGKKGYKTLEIEVTPTSKVALEAENLTVTAAKRVFNPLAEVNYEALDERDGQINDKVEVVESNVNIEVAGIYSLRLAVMNSEGSEVTEEVAVIVDEVPTVIEEPEVTEPDVTEPDVPETPEVTVPEAEVPEVIEPDAPEIPDVEEPTEATQDVAEPEKTKEVEKVEVTNDPKTEPVKEAEKAKEQAKQEPLEAEKEEVKAETKVDKKAGPDKLLQTDIKPLNPALSLIGGIALVTAGLYFFKKSFLLFKTSIANLKNSKNK